MFHFLKHIQAILAFLWLVTFWKIFISSVFEILNKTNINYRQCFRYTNSLVICIRYSLVIVWLNITYIHETINLLTLFPAFLDLFTWSEWKWQAYVIHFFLSKFNIYEIPHVNNVFRLKILQTKTNRHYPVFFGTLFVSI